MACGRQDLGNDDLPAVLPVVLRDGDVQLDEECSLFTQSRSFSAGGPLLEDVFSHCWYCLVSPLQPPVFAREGRFDQVESAARGEVASGLLGEDGTANGRSRHHFLRVLLVR